MNNCMFNIMMTAIYQARGTPGAILYKSTHTKHALFAMMFCMTKQTDHIIDCITNKII
jgi:hypothetical protein